MIFINNTQIDLALLKPGAPTGGRNYRGGDEIMAMIATEWQRLVDRYGNGDAAITFIRPHIKSGYGTGSMGGSYQRSVIINTSTGTKTVTWCEVALQNGNNTYDFRPKTFAHTPEVGLTLFMHKNIEQILWHTLFDPLRNRKYSYPLTDMAGKPHPKAGKQVPCIYILDPDDDAASYIVNGAKSADLWYFLASPTSPIIGDRPKINLLASAWSVFKPEEKSDAIVRQMLIQAVELAEAKNDADYGYAAFSKAVNDILSGGDTTNTEIMALVNKATDRGIIKYYPSKMAWFLVTESGVEIKRLCTVPASKSEKSKEVLVGYLTNNDDDMALIQASVDAKPLVMKEIRKFYIPQPPTKEFFQNMKHPKQKAICSLVGIDHFGKTKIQLADDLIGYFIISGKTIPPENLLDQPEE